MPSSSDNILDLRVLSGSRIRTYFQHLAQSAEHPETGSRTGAEHGALSSRTFQKRFDIFFEDPQGRRILAAVFCLRPDGGSSVLSWNSNSHVKVNGQELREGMTAPLNENDQIEIGKRLYSFGPEGPVLVTDNLPLLKTIWPSGFNNINIRQGTIRSCYLLAGIRSLSGTPLGQAYLADFIDPTKDAAFLVRFKGILGHDGNPLEFRISLKQLNDFKRRAMQLDPQFRSTSADLGVQLLEVAYNRLRREMRGAGPRDMLPLEWGHPEIAIKHLTGCKVTDRVTTASPARADEPTQYKLGEFITFEQALRRPGGDNTAEVLDLVLRRLAHSRKANNAVTAITPSELPDYGIVAPGLRIPRRHAFSVDRVVESNESPGISYKIWITDPIDTTKRTWAVSDREFKRFFGHLSVVGLTQ